MIIETQPDTKTCIGCAQPFHRRPAPLDSSFRWMRRKFCSGICARGQFRRGPVKAARQIAAGTP